MNSYSLQHSAWFRLLQLLFGIFSVCFLSTSIAVTFLLIDKTERYIDIEHSHFVCFGDDETEYDLTNAQKASIASKISGLLQKHGIDEVLASRSKFGNPELGQGPTETCHLAYTGGKKSPWTQLEKELGVFEATKENYAVKLAEGVRWRYANIFLAIIAAAATSLLVLLVIRSAFYYVAVGKWK